MLTCWWSRFLVQFVHLNSLLLKRMCPIEIADEICLIIIIYFFHLLKGLGDLVQLSVKRIGKGVYQEA